MDAISEQRLTQVWPTLALRVRQMALTLATLNIDIRVTQGLRTVAEQEELYAQGRTTPGKIVTNCRGGQSYHNFGMAVDCVPSTQGVGGVYTPDWNPSHPVWKQMIGVGVDLGLDSGALWRTFKDYPHFQLTGQYPEGEPNAQCSSLLVSGGLQLVWNSIVLKETA